MTWTTIFDGDVLGDHITIEWFVDDEIEGEYSVRVKAKDYSPDASPTPLVEPGSVIFPIPPKDPSKRYNFEYDSIDEMYKKFAGDSGRSERFVEAIEKAIGNT
ncbi:hypothetical protein [Serratia sp. PL7]|uniref:hypothetical protein n=1 Tax=Serratia sp. PL7 TaxID=2952201 RepID=UPI0019E02A56|nr:hypothetical protein [Serratia sp. PL7]MBE0149640.1 hypothetical protein [Serratia fonticola]